MKPLVWDLSPVPWRYRALRQFDFSDVPGSPAEWVDLAWEHLPAIIRDVLKQMR